jgi:glycine/D-amino acid oxidase-like deaminating enzyme
VSSGNKRVAVLGAGIQGSCAALAFREAGIKVDLFDKEAVPVSRASRWNEGKLHLGFVFAHDRSWRTARTVIGGSISFCEILEHLTGRRIIADAISNPFNYVISKDSLVSQPQLADAYQRISGLFAACQQNTGMRYFGEEITLLCEEVPDRDWRRDYSDAKVQAVFRTAERSIDPAFVANHLGEAINAAEHITSFYNTGVESIDAASHAGPFYIVTVAGDRHGPYDSVINAMWENRLGIDAQLGITPQRSWLHRYKHAVHLRGLRNPSIPCSTMVLGLFGDYVYFGNGAGYLSWYPVCRTAMTSELVPSSEHELVSADEKRRILRQTWQGMADYMPALANERIDMEHADVEGGFIFAWGSADINDLRSELHHRSDVGVRSYGQYHSIDTGKYCLGPLFALDVVRRVSGNYPFKYRKMEELLEWIRQ